MSDRALSVASLIKVGLLLVAACLIAAGTTGCVEPPEEEDDLADVAEPVEAATCEIRVDLWVRFWRNGHEVSCAQAIADGYQLEAGVLGEGYSLTVARGWCQAAVQPDPRQRVGTGVFTVTNAVAGRNLAVRVGRSVEHVVPVTACGATGSHTLSIVLPPPRGEVL